MPSDFKEGASKNDSFVLPEGLVDQLLRVAADIRENAYAPYSSFRVGAAVLADDGRIFAGANVENASYGATICAERAAIFSAVSAGVRKIRSIAIIAAYPMPIPPCGMCRQVMSEFGKNIIVIMANTAGDRRVETIDSLLPHAFDLTSAGEANGKKPKTVKWT